MGSSVSVVIVDDEADLARSMAELLGAHGYRAEALTSLENALEVLPARQEPFVLLLDHNFEGSNHVGYELCERLRTEHPMGLILPVLYWSAVEDVAGYSQRVRTDLAFSPTAFVDKTRGNAELLEVVRAAVANLNEVLELFMDQAVQQAFHAFLEAGAARDQSEGECDDDGSGASA